MKEEDIHGSTDQTSSIPGVSSDLPETLSKLSSSCIHIIERIICLQILMISARLEGFYEMSQTGWILVWS